MSLTISGCDIHARKALLRTLRVVCSANCVHWERNLKSAPRNAFHVQPGLIETLRLLENSSHAERGLRVLELRLQVAKVQERGAQIILLKKMAGVAHVYPASDLYRKLGHVCLAGRMSSAMEATYPTAPLAAKACDPKQPGVCSKSPVVSARKVSVVSVVSVRTNVQSVTRAMCGVSIHHQVQFRMQWIALAST